jgi:fatty-acyl-CoA synthase
VKIVDADGRIVPQANFARAAIPSCSAIGTTRQRPAKLSTPRARCTRAASQPSTPEGYCNIVGRIKDMVIRGGENLYPREIEEFLFRHPKIQEVESQRFSKSAINQRQTPHPIAIATFPKRAPLAI